MKPRVLFIAPLPPPVHGSSMMSKFIQDSELINKTFDCDYVNLSTSRQMDEIQNFSLRKVWRLLYIYITILGKLLTCHYELCYCAIACFGIPFLKDSFIVLLCKLFVNKVVIHQHNKGMHSYCHRPIYRHLYRVVYRNTKVILLSWYLYDDIKDVVNKEQVMICPNGVPDIKLTEKVKMLDGESGCKFLYLSNLIPSKGCNVLLDALVLLKQKGAQFSCDFIGGDCPEQSASQFMDLIRKKDLTDCVQYLGRKYGSEKNVFFDEADIFVFPTFYAPECFPVVLLEAMQHRLPCITTCEAAIPDIIKDGENGFLCEKQNPEDLANKIEMLLNNRELRMRMGENGYKKFKEMFTLSIFERNFQNCLQHCL